MASTTRQAPSQAGQAPEDDIPSEGKQGTTRSRSEHVCEGERPENPHPRDFKDCRHVSPQPHKRHKKDARKAASSAICEGLDTWRYMNRRSATR